MEKKVVSPFEFAICEIADPEKAKTLRPETEQERAVRIEKDIRDFHSRIVIKTQ